MTPVYMTLTLGPRKNSRRKVAFLLEKAVVYNESVNMFLAYTFYTPKVAVIA